MKGEILTIHIGECGTKIGLPYWQILHNELSASRANHSSSSPKQLPSLECYNSVSFFEEIQCSSSPSSPVPLNMFPESLPVQEASGSGKQVAHSPRALFVDTDPYTQVYIQNKYPPLCAIPPRNVHIDKHVITAGDYHIALENLNESSDKLIDLIRSKL